MCCLNSEQQGLQCGYEFWVGVWFHSNFSPCYSLLINILMGVCGLGSFVDRNIRLSVQHKPLQIKSRLFLILFFTLFTSVMFCSSIRVSVMPRQKQNLLHVMGVTFFLIIPCEHSKWTKFRQSFQERFWAPTAKQMFAICTGSLWHELVHPQKESPHATWFPYESHTSCWVFYTRNNLYNQNTNSELDREILMIHHFHDNNKLIHWL